MPLIQIQSLPLPADDDAAQLRTHRLLRTYLENAGIGDVESVQADAAPEGARSSGGILLNIFNIVLNPVFSGAASVVVTMLFEYVRRGKRPVTVKVNGAEFTFDATTIQQNPDLVAKLLSAAIGEEDGE
ncbi:hypothetical protein [Stackebrandtia nassauensis]|uniref:Uncharacterized protein n=1 Tax=Stackebrandtia nassauensis (strain DSM 44728 / CIP 108903 / NRRL B-16338 / NBRC 102104 / LLR-40K-21) TaxID=446470 RepID=D3Q9D4_STANL|nr:hypothetical protein [Stackebrandtia nassauensis]ADD42616.1 hypothetical protein Snas_2941 [Stackebrandtia nassauensis DSM 44728]